MPTAGNPDSTDAGGDLLAFPSALAQEAFYYLEQLRPGATPFNVAVRSILEGNLDPDILKRAFETIIDRHESLRTSFEMDGGDLLQIVSPSVIFPFETVDIGLLSEQERDAELQRIGLIEACKPFDLHRGPLIRSVLVRLSDQKHILHVTIHHAVSDGWSIGVLNDELSAIYGALVRGQDSPLPPLPIQYGDFAVWQHDFITGPEVTPQLNYWKTRLAGMAEPDLPTDHPRPAVKRWNGDIVSELLPVELTDRLSEIAKSNSATLFHVFLSVFNLLLSRYSESEDIIVGTPLAGRNRPELEPLIGTFINSIVIRTDLSGDLDFHKVVRRVRDGMVDALAHQDVPFEAIVRELKPERDQSRNPLFQINFTHQRAFIKPLEFGGDFGGIRQTGIPSLSPGAIFDLHFFTVERDGVWRVSCDYCTDLFERSTALRMLGHFQKLLAGVATAPDRPVRQLSLLTEDELRQIMDWKGKETTYPRESTIGGLFVEVAAAHPERIALVQGSRRITYRQLLAHATRLAQTLRERGVSPGTMVAIAAAPSPETMSGLIAISLAGGAYVPIDPNHPEERIRFLMEDAGATVLLAEPANAHLCADRTHVNISLNLIDGEETPVPINQAGITAEHPAYVLYTSGSTGRPKGVIVSHRAVARLVRGTDFMQFGPDEVFLQAAPLSFDASTLEIWGPLLNGGTLVILDRGAAGLVNIAQAVQAHGVTTLWLTAGLFQIMVDEHLNELKGLRNLLAGGDVLSIAHVRRAFEALPGTRLINGYGPTENTTFTTCHTITSEDLKGSSISIGRPIANTTVYILDPDGHPCPIGVPGEILTGGDGLSSGYIGNAPLTAQKFIQNPLAGAEGEILYRTGDRGRWRHDGTIEFLGRRDRQVKIRGVRIEPAEVEATISSHPAVSACKVGIHGGSAENKTLVAWVSPIPGETIDHQQLSDFLSERLPPFLCPDAIVVLDSLPLTANGKVDADALPHPDHLARTRSAPPATDTERKLAEIWCDLLKLPTVGRDDNFFHLGGHSLLGLKLFSRLQRAFDFSLPLATLLKAPTLRSLGIVLDAGLAAKKSENHGDHAVLATILRDGNLSPFFCIHGGDGGIIFYRNLAAHLSHDRPMVAIEAPALHTSGEIRIASVEETAAEYVRLVKKRQSRGPYFLGGYSFGGAVAYEMARQLRLEGDEIALLAMFDTMNPAISCPEFSLSERVRKFLDTHSDVPLALRAAKILGHGIKRVRHRLFPAPAAPAASDDDLRSKELNEAHYRSLRAYAPKPYDGKLILFRALIEDGVYKIPRDLGWTALVRELELVMVPGHHLTMFDPENVGELGREIQRHLTRAQT